MELACRKVNEIMEYFTSDERYKNLMDIVGELTAEKVHLLGLHCRGHGSIRSNGVFDEEGDRSAGTS